MHEISIAENILNIMEDAARSEGFSKVIELYLEIGMLASVEIEALTFCLDAVLKNTIADNAKITLERSPGRGWCHQCNDTVSIHAFYDPCPHCGGYQVEVTAGTEMRVKNIMVEE